MFHLEARNEHGAAQQWRIQQAKREAAEMRSAIRRNFSTINQVKPWKQARRQRVRQTAEWFLQEPAFCDWRADQNTASLWCSGTMGVGKTILVSNLVAHLHAPPRNQADIISYYFCRSDDEESLRARNIIGSLSCQMLNTQIERANGDTLSDLYHKSQDLDTEDVIDLVTSRLEDDKTYYVILDGVDECESNDVRDVARGLASLCDKRVKDLKILCSGRPELEKELFRTHKPKYKMALTEQKVESDMDRYIDTTLHQCLEDGHLKLSDPRLILNIEEALRKGSDGM